MFQANPTANSLTDGSATSFEQAPGRMRKMAHIFCEYDSKQLNPGTSVLERKPSVPAYDP
jgi:hypothetical protein